MGITPTRAAGNGLVPRLVVGRWPRTRLRALVLAGAVALVMGCWGGGRAVRRAVPVAWVGLMLRLFIGPSPIFTALGLVVLGSRPEWKLVGA